MIKPSLPNWRSILFVPAHLQKFVHKAHTRGADAINLDLEDSVPVAEKAQARQQLPSQMSQLLENNLDVLVRVNQELRACALDLEVAVIPGVKAITLPKAMGAEHIRLVDESMAELERSRGMAVGGIGIIAMIETIDALSSVEQIANSCPRLIGLSLGSEDFSCDGGFEPTSANLFNPCQKIIFAARSANIQAYGFPGSIAEYSDLDSFREMAAEGKKMGFKGAFCIHPNQVEIINWAFQVTEAELEQARKIVAAYEDAVTQQLGAIEVDGKMVDLPVVMRAKEVLKSND